MIMGEERRLFEYFVVAGLPESPEELNPGAQECGYKNTAPLPPVTDICVIFPGLGEQVPQNFTCIETTPSGFTADLNHGSIRTQSCFLCYRRGYHKSPLMDIGVLYEGRGERVNVDSQIVKTTPFGRPANVNNASQGIYLTYRRASDNAHSNLLAVTEICVIITNKGETPPHTFYKINRNLNKGMVGSDVYICYKKSMANCNRIAYKPSILDRFPLEDYSDYPLPSNVPIFGLPMGALLECWPAKCQAPGRQFLTFVLTDHKGHKLYGAAIIFYETYDRFLTAEQLEKLGANVDPQQRVGSCSDSSSTNDPAETMTFHTNKCICVVSRYPFFNAFRRFLLNLHQMSTTGEHSLPIERYLSHLLYEVPFPTARRPRILVQIGAETICFDNPEDSPLPLSGASLVDFVRLLGPDNCMYLMLLALTEQKILIHSLRPWHLTSVAEALCSLLFPFHWQCPYIPQCPLDLAGVLHAPLPFIAGVDSRYFELYEDPPKDVTCVDVDTNTISQSDIRHKIKLSLLPRKAAKALRQQLETLQAKTAQAMFHIGNARSQQGLIPVEVDLQNINRRRNLDLEIQEAFLRFMVQILKGYQQYLKPMRSAPAAGATDLESLFDVNGFLRSRDKSSLEFFKLLTSTQLFIRFIEERSLLSDKDKNAYLAFFDECMDKVEGNTSGDHVECTKLLEYEFSSPSDRVVYFAPPESLTPDKKFVYGNQFPKLELDNFALDSLISENNRLMKTPKHLSTHDTPASAARRTKQEARAALKLAKQQKVLSPVSWAKCVLSYAYSLWFTHLPAYAEASSLKQKVLRDAYNVLDRMQTANLAPMLDEVCYRILIQVCGMIGQPVMAVKVFLDMKRQRIQPNAITYGFYNRAVLEGQWPSTTTLSAQKYWTKIRMSVRAIALLKRGLKERQRARRTLSQYSTESGDLASQASFGSQTMKKSNCDVASTMTGISNDQGTFLTTGYDRHVDQGYHSQTTYDSVSVSTDQVDNGGKGARFGTAKLNDWNLAAFDELYKKGRAIIAQRSMRSSLLSYDSAAGLLISSDLSKLDDSVFDTSPSAVHAAKTKRARNRSLVENVYGKAKTTPPKLYTSLSEPEGGMRMNTNGKETTNGSDGLEKYHPNEPVESNPSKQVDQPNEWKNTKLMNIPEEGHVDMEESVEEDTSSQFRRSHSRSPTKIIRTAVTDSSHPLSIAESNDQAGNGQKREENVNQTTMRTPLLEKKPFEDELRRSESPTTPNEDTNNASGGSSFLGLSGFGRNSMRGLWSRINSTTPISRLNKSQTVDSNFQTPPRRTSLADSSTASIETDEFSTDTPQNAANPVGTLSPTLNHIMSQGARMISKVDALQKSSEGFTRFKTGVSNVMKSFKGNLEQQLGSPIRGSWSSLSLGDAAAMGYVPMPISLVGDDSMSLNNEDYCTGGLWINDDTSSLTTATGLAASIDFDADPAFQLSSGETGSLVGGDFLAGGGGSRVMMDADAAALDGNGETFGLEVLLCTTSRCEKCSALLYDEEIIAGWSADESDLSTQCQFCGEKRVPNLTVVIRRQQFSSLESWYSKTSSLKRRRNGLGSSSMSSKEINRRCSLNSADKKEYDSGTITGTDQRLSDSLELLPTSPAEIPSSSSELNSPACTTSEASPLPLESSPKAPLARARAGSDADRSLLKQAVNRRLFLDLTSSSTLGETDGNDRSMHNDHHSVAVPYLSPFVIRKELETVLSSEGDEALTQAVFVKKHPILYWNLLYVFRRLAVPTHITSWIMEEYGEKFFASEIAKNGEKGSFLNDVQLTVRCVYDSPFVYDQHRHSLTPGSVNSMDSGSGTGAMTPFCRPVYSIVQLSCANEAQCSPLMKALLIDDHYLVLRAIATQIIDYLAVPNLHKPIMILINEHRKRSASKGHHSLPKHFSIYRDILFLALSHFGHCVRRDDFDREYALAMGKLPPMIAGKLAPDDRQPSLMVKACRKIFIPLDLC